MPATTPWLLCQVHEHVCALPLAQVIEVMRPLPLLAVAQSPECVLGLCVMRGAPVPVIDLARCLCARSAAPTRFVAVELLAPGAPLERRIALAVDAVSGTISLDPEQLAAVPPLLSRASSALDAVTTLDTRLLMLLQTSRFLTDSELSELASHVGTD